MRRLPIHLFFLSLTLCPTMGGAAASAGPPGLPEPGKPNPAAAAEAQKRAGAAFKAKDFDDALVEGKAAYAAGGGVDALETIAVAALKVGNAALALQCYEAIVADSDAPAGVAGRAKNQLAALKGQTGSVEVVTRPTGATVSVGGESLGQTPLAPLRFFAGKAEITVTFSDGTRRVEKVNVTAGKAQRVEVSGPTPAPPPVAVAPIPSVVPAPVVVPMPAPAPVPAKGGSGSSVRAAVDDAAQEVGEVAKEVGVEVAKAGLEAAKAAAPGVLNAIGDAVESDAKPGKTGKADAKKSQASAAAPVDLGPPPKHPVMASMHKLAEKLGGGLKPPTPDSVRRIAVMPFAPAANDTSDATIGQLSAELLSTRLIIQPGVMQVERQRIDAVAAPIQRAEGGQFSEAGAVSAGKLLGANAVVVGTFGNAGQEMLLTARVVDVETGQVVAAGDEAVPRQAFMAVNADAVELRTPAGAMLRSIALPGWGQMYNGDTIRGLVYTVGAVGLGGTAAASAALAVSAQNDYQKNTPDTVGRRDDANEHITRTNVALVSLGVVWLASVVDAYVTGEDSRTMRVPDELNDR